MCYDQITSIETHQNEHLEISHNTLLMLNVVNTDYLSYRICQF